MRYKFTLNWEELPKELQQRKIDEYIQAAYQAGEYAKSAGEPERSLMELLGDRKVRNEAESKIQDHLLVWLFPIGS